MTRFLKFEGANTASAGTGRKKIAKKCETTKFLKITT